MHTINLAPRYALFLAQGLFWRLEVITTLRAYSGSSRRYFAYNDRQCCSHYTDHVSPSIRGACADFALDPVSRREGDYEKVDVNIIMSCTEKGPPVKERRSVNSFVFCEGRGGATPQNRRKKADPSFN